MSFYKKKHRLRGRTVFWWLASLTSLTVWLHDLGLFIGVVTIDLCVLVWWYA